ncbi:uncharacterized protein [Dermacentor andersoni]|uniref:uncharacterized protein n=1 Tax=Dermacentor andersoni TaxID=34620 RepID=UPI002415B0B8|nr:uncharacterized protein LOC126516189 isoform X2 [Dermacentor andersoni]XP_054920043.1 uncharacterized protein LOC126516189 isoform X2 [Dermacentor andersoni]XP_054920047.1 uncharacterized protein LOC126516189 isoform X2 [Dermacentor andersoni]XP_054920050.1 uncharacterized protein LOC126516189 isoform X2 [Dermacentor andersoni]
MMNISTKSMTRRPPKGFSKMTHPGDIFAVDCLRSIVPTQEIVAQMNEDYKKAMHATYIDEANLTLMVENLHQASNAIANEPTCGHHAHPVITDQENMRARFNLQKTYERCWLGHAHATGTRVTVIATGVTEDFSRRAASFVVRHL